MSAVADSSSAVDREIAPEGRPMGAGGSLTWGWTFVASAAAFGAYFSMYAFRKPISAATFDDETFWDGAVTLKAALLVSQILGYALSKFLGAGICSRVGSGRWAWLLGLILAAQASLLLFAVLPREWKPLALFLNGLPLGMVWGLVVRYLEGRTRSDLTLAVLCFSFIFGSGAVKDVARWLMSLGVSEWWMPAAAGALFFVPFVVAVALLERLPAANAVDRSERHERKSMTLADCCRYVLQFGTLLFPLIVFYVALTAFRDYRDNFQVELLAGRVADDDLTLLTRIETVVAVVVTAVGAALVLVRDHSRALAAIVGSMLVGAALLAGATLMRQNGQLGDVFWMTAIGLGVYLAYVPYNAVLFERLMARTRAFGTAVFAIYLADACGYGASVFVQLGKDVLARSLSHQEFFVGLSYTVAAIGVVCLIATFADLARRGLLRPEPREAIDSPSLVPASLANGPVSLAVDGPLPASSTEAYARPL